MRMRGVGKQNSYNRDQRDVGVFREKQETRDDS